MSCMELCGKHHNMYCVQIIRPHAVCPAIKLSLPISMVYNAHINVSFLHAMNMSGNDT